MRLRLAVCAAAAMLILLPGGGGAQPQGELRVGIPWTPENLDPTMNLSSIRAMVGVSMFDSLVGRDASVEGYAHDPAQARKLLAEAGYPAGLEITLESPTGRCQGDKEIAEAPGGQWQKAGFKPKVQVVEWGAYFKGYPGKQFQDAYRLGLGGPQQDADELYKLVSSKGGVASTTRMNAWTST